MYSMMKSKKPDSTQSISNMKGLTEFKPRFFMTIVREFHIYYFCIDEILDTSCKYSQVVQKIFTGGPCLMRLLVLGKSRISHNSHQPNISLLQFALKQILGYFISLVRFFGYFCPKNSTNEIAQNWHKANIYGFF